MKLPEYTDVDADEFELLDLRRWDSCLIATRDVDHVYALAADMGGMGFISANHATILRNNTLINLHTLEGGQDPRGVPVPVQLIGVHLPGVPPDRGRRGAAP